MLGWRTLVVWTSSISYVLLHNLYFQIIWQIQKVSLAIFVMKLALKVIWADICNETTNDVHIANILLIHFALIWKKHIKVNHPDEVFIDQKFSSDYEIPCKSCSKKFRKDKIQNHELTNHIPCNFCEYFTESYTNDIDDHIQEKHPEKTIFRKCIYHDKGCHFRSHSRKKIRRHQFSCYNFYNKD